VPTFDQLPDRAVLPPQQIEEVQMQKAHLYEAILLVNRGIDEAVRGLERLKRAEGSGLDPAYFDEKLTLFEVHRALLDGCFCNNVESYELRDEARFEKRRREYQKKALDEVQVYQDVQAVEESRRLEGKAPRVRFFGGDDQPNRERQHPNSPSDTERRWENDHA
jgi:hypothetical protein